MSGICPCQGSPGDCLVSCEHIECCTGECACMTLSCNRCARGGEVILHSRVIPISFVVVATVGLGSVIYRYYKDL